jgi:glycosyl transferase family 25
MVETVQKINDVLQQYFDKVLVLTVPRFKERQEQVMERLAGISFEFFYGTDKNDLDEKLIAENYTYDKRNSLAVRQVFSHLNTGEIACSLSHRNIYQAMIDNGWKRILIFEDDIVPDLNSFSRLTNVIGELPDNWELLYLGYLKNEKATTGKKIKQLWYIIMSWFGFSRLTTAMLMNSLPKPFSNSLMKAGFHDCTHAYAISVEGAKKLIEVQTPVKYRADNLLSALVMKGKLKAFISKYQFFNQAIFLDKDDKSYVRLKPPR